MTALNMKALIVTDAFDRNAKSRVLKIGNAYLFECERLNNLSAQDWKAIASIPDWASSRKPATQRVARAAIASLGLECETRFDAAHGRRYKLCVYPPLQAARRVALAASDDLDNTDAVLSSKAVWEQLT